MGVLFCVFIYPHTKFNSYSFPQKYLSVRTFHPRQCSASVCWLHLLLISFKPNLCKSTSSEPGPVMALLGIQTVNTTKQGITRRWRSSCPYSCVRSTQALVAPVILFPVNSNCMVICGRSVLYGRGVCTVKR